MKKIAYNILLAGAASLLIGHAQTNAIIPVNTNPPAVVLTGAIDPVALPTTNQTAAPNDLATTTTNVVVPPPASVTDTNVPAPVTTTPIAPGIPLIQFSDVPITTAIENLARQSGINYMLDPKIGYGAPDANGQIRTEPTLSIRWENITAENALLALLDNYGLQLIKDKKTSIARISLKDPLAPPVLITRVVQLKYSSVSNMTDAVQSTFTDKRSKVLADSRTSQIVVSATETEQTAVDTLIAQLDKPTKQVLIEARFVEVSSNPQTSKGIDWSGTLAAQNVSFGNGVTGSKPSAGGSSGGSSSSTATSIPGTPLTSSFG